MQCWRAARSAVTFSRKRREKQLPGSKAKGVKGQRVCWGTYIQHFIWLNLFTAINVARPKASKVKGHHSTLTVVSLYWGFWNIQRWFCVKISAWVEMLPKEEHLGSSGHQKHFDLTSNNISYRKRQKEKWEITQRYKKNTSVELCVDSGSFLDVSSVTHANLWNTLLWFKEGNHCRANRLWMFHGLDWTEAGSPCLRRACLCREPAERLNLSWINSIS